MHIGIGIGIHANRSLVGEAYLRSLNPAAWFRPYRAPGTVTVTGSGVSQLDDASGNARHLKQGTDANRPCVLQTGAATAVGAGSVFTRATTATVEDWEGCIKVTKSGEVRFPGARRVENLLANTVDATNANWVAAGTATKANAGNDVISIGLPATLDSVYVRGVSVVAIGASCVGAVDIRSATGSAGQIEISDAFAAQHAKVLDVTTDWVRYSTNVWAALNTSQALRFRRTLAGYLSAIEVRFPQVEDVTGQSNQNPSEYVPVGALSSPFHGAMVDGVKYFEYENGNTVAANIVTEATGATLNTLAGTLVETASTNLVLQSSNFGTTWAAVGTPTRSAAAKYCGSIALDLIGDDAAGALEGYTQTVTFTANAVKSVSFLAYPGTSASTMVRLRDTTAGADRLLAAITWSGGVPTVTYTTGSEERAPKALAGGVYRIFCKTASVTAANTNSLEFYPASDAALATAATGTVYIGGVQAENATTASSHIPTTTASAPRNADRLGDTLGDAIYGDGAAFKMATDAFTANQPRTRLSVVYPISWTSGDFLDSGTAAEAGLTQTGSTPSVSLNAGSAAAANTGLTLGAWHVVCEVINGASSSVTVDNGAETTGDAGANNPGGIALFSNQAGSGYFNGMIREYIDLPIALDATQRARAVRAIADGIVSL